MFNGDSDKGLIAFTNSDWASDKIMCKSQTGYFFQLASTSIFWQSHAQKNIALSSTKAEYMALQWLKKLFKCLPVLERLY